MPQGKLLIVDDNADLVKILAARFAAQGYHVITGTDGDDALDLYSRERPDVMLLDIHMPRLDGAAVVRQIRELDHEVGLIVMTGDHDHERAKMLVDEGVCDFILKPIDMGYLETSVSTQMLVRRSPTGGPS